MTGERGDCPAPRRAEIVALFARGRSIKAIARALGCAPSTVKNHLARARARGEVADDRRQRTEDGGQRAAHRAGDEAALRAGARGDDASHRAGDDASHRADNASILATLRAESPRGYCDHALATASADLLLGLYGLMTVSAKRAVWREMRDRRGFIAAPAAASWCGSPAADCAA